MSIDSTEHERDDGWTVRAELHPDPDATPAEYDCYTARDKMGFARGDWSFVIVVVTVSREGIELGGSSLGAVEYGWLNDDIHADPLHDGTVTELAAEAIDAGLAQLAKLCTAAASVT